jgi:hypothetical protein
MFTCITSSTSGPNAGARREASGDMIIVRYADDIIVGFQYEKMPDGFGMPCACVWRITRCRFIWK